MNNKNLNEIASSAGMRLEEYKRWYRKQPKFIRVAILPGLLGVLLLSAKLLGIEGGWGGFIFLAIMCLIFWNAYNQYLDSLYIEDVENIEKQREKWRGLVGRYLFLNQLLQQLVERKSEMFLQTLKIESKQGRPDAVTFIQENNSLKNNLVRILAITHAFFSRFADHHSKEKLRVVFLGPSEEDENKLVVKGWFNDDSSPPLSFQNGKEDKSFL